MSRFMASNGLLHADEVAARSRTEERRVAGRMAAMWMCVRESSPEAAWMEVSLIRCSRGRLS